jgi:hypothetical protein
MKIETYTCIKQTDNRSMGVECYSKPNTVFYFDRNGWVKVGDEVKLERDYQGFYRRVWVNGELKTDDNFGDIHGRD